jgi:hypothetical protein
MLGPLTAPPDSTAPPGEVTLDAPRQAILDDLVSLGIMRDQPVEPYCLVPLLAEFPDDEMDSLAARVLGAIDDEISGVVGERVAGPSTDAEIDLAYDSLVCIAGDADPELVDEAVSSVSDDEDFADWNLDCVRATLTAFPDDMLADVADGDDPSDVRARLDETIDDARESTSEEDVGELMNHVTSFFFCRPDGRELIADTGASPDTSPGTTDG